MTTLSNDSTFTEEEILDAIHWCRLGRVRPDRDGAFDEAKRRGLLAQDPVWRATTEGELLLATRRPEAYGRRPFAIECPTCGAQPRERCQGLRRSKYRTVHARRERAAAAPGWGS